MFIALCLVCFNNICVLFFVKFARKFVMSEPRSKQKRNIHHKYRISIINEETFDEVRRTRISVFNVLFFIAVIFVISGLIVVSAIFYTPLKGYVPGYPDSEIQTTLIENAVRLDSLILKMQQEEKYWDGVRKVLLGEISNEVLEDTSTHKNKEYILEQLRLQASQKELDFREEIEQEEQYNLGLLDKASEKKNSQTLYLSPVKGMIIDHFDKESEHYGVDIVASPKAHITSVDDGTVVFAGYTIETGNVISIQHRDNIISTYKHASSIYKKLGDKVKVGEVIGIVGNTGTLSTGDHLHFEIWKDGETVDPKSLIVF